MSNSPDPKWEERLTPPDTKPTSSVAAVRDDWYVVAIGRSLGSEPLATTLLGTPIVVYRTASGVPAALLDRCPHRNVPLSLGRVRGEHLECGYHGWRFDRDGACRAIPGLCGEVSDSRARHVPSFATREEYGFVWVYGTPDTEPLRDPFPFPHQDDPNYTTVRQTLELEGSLHAAAENALDVPHTAFLHRGLFRKDGGARSEITVDVRRFHDRVEAEYIGEARPEGLIGRVLAPAGGTVTHFDRFILPCIAQVEYRLGDKSHLVATTALTPRTDHTTGLFAAVSFRFPFLHGGVVGRALEPLAMRILRQDATMLRAQTANVRRFGGERYATSELDVLGPHILRLLRQAERGRGEGEGVEPTLKTTRMQV